MSAYELEISNSDVQVFKSCRRRWWLSSYRRLGPKGQQVVGPLALGTRVHAALEAYYTDLRDPVEAHSELLAVDRNTLLFEGRDISALEDEGELGRIMIEGYLEWVQDTGLDSDYTVISAEEVLAIPIEVNGRSVLLKGKLDMRVKRADGIRFIVDHKTAAGIDKLEKLSHMEEQFKFYLLLESLVQKEDERCAGALIRVLKKVKRTASARPPFYEQIEVRHNQKTITNFWYRTYYTIADMLALKDALDSGADPVSVAYPTPSGDCSWKCPFVQVCPMFDDGSAAEDMLAEYFEERDPHARYNDEKKVA